MSIMIIWLGLVIYVTATTINKRLDRIAAALEASAVAPAERATGEA